MSATRLVLLAALILPRGLLADARETPWREFLAPVTLICSGEVVASRILDDPHSLSRTLPDGTTVTPLQTYMVSTVRVSRSLRGTCPPVIDLKWEVPIAFPAFDLELDHVRSEWVLFLGEEVPSAPSSNRTFTVLPRQAWRRETLFSEEDKAIPAYHPQHISLPEQLIRKSRIKVYCRGTALLVDDELVPEEGLFEYLSHSQ